MKSFLPLQLTHYQLACQSQGSYMGCNKGDNQVLYKIVGILTETKINCFTFGFKSLPLRVTYGTSVTLVPGNVLKGRAG